MVGLREARTIVVVAVVVVVIPLVDFCPRIGYTRGDGKKETEYGRIPGLADCECCGDGGTG